ncbi:hypothetical protein OVA26_16570 [Microbacterium sp. SL62]|uniref:site-specific integrase n=1 Tax=Microbacterium sp. SL62 TaxID=2995139 RepID=UPI002275DA04|nr:hypothetical protein [Microbacterium sp. SL62]MCY1718552.1 hypothetical protein [Microbacterium sp. SL62]
MKDSWGDTSRRISPDNVAADRALTAAANQPAHVVVLSPDAAVPARVDSPLPQGLVDGIESLHDAASASNTVRAYESDWTAFSRWCDDHDQTSLPASGVTVAGYLTDRANLLAPSGDYAYAPSTLSRWVTAINARHHEAGLPEPGTLSVVKKTLAGIRRSHLRPTRRMAPLLLTDLRTVLSGIDLNAFPNGVIGHRDYALLVLGFAGAFRRSELASRLIQDVVLHSIDGLHIRLQTSKTDQEGRGSLKALPYGAHALTCAPCAFLRWIRVLDTAQNEPRSAMMRLLRSASTHEHICRAPVPELERLDPKGPLFRAVRRGGHIGVDAISGDVVNDVVKRRIEHAGMDPKRFGGHSLRAGFVTQALRDGASPEEVMRQSFHRNAAIIENVYRREGDPLRGNAVNRIAL